MRTNDNLARPRTGQISSRGNKSWNTTRWPNHRADEPAHSTDCRIAHKVSSMRPGSPILLGLRRVKSMKSRILSLVLTSSLTCWVFFAGVNERLKVSKQSGPAPFAVQVIGPERLVRLARGYYQGWTGCGYSILWGDGPYSSSPQGPVGSDCSEGFKHLYEEPGTYVIKAKIYHLGPADEAIEDWSDQIAITVSKK